MLVIRLPVDTNLRNSQVFLFIFGTDVSTVVIGFLVCDGFLEFNTHSNRIPRDTPYSDEDCISPFIYLIEWKQSLPNSGLIPAYEDNLRPNFLPFLLPQIMIIVDLGLGLRSSSALVIQASKSSLLKGS